MTESPEPWTSAREHDLRVRVAAMEFLRRQQEIYPETLPREVLARGFEFEEQRVPLVSPQGIFKPAVLPEMPLSISTAPEVEGKERPYDDSIDPESGLVVYRYRGTDPQHRDNVGLRLAMKRQAPLIYLKGIVKGEYVAAFPAYIVRDEPSRLAFHVAVDAMEAALGNSASAPSEVAEDRRRYQTRLVLQRMHQQSFRSRVIAAYLERCAVCRLRHRELLDAAHILEDGHEHGLPIVPNGLALCKLHHAAFDQNIMGVTPDLRVEIRLDVLKEIDGPMLKHGLQGFQGAVVSVPKAAHLRPNREFLAERFEIFRKAG